MRLVHGLPLENRDVRRLLKQERGKPGHAISLFADGKGDAVIRSIFFRKLRNLLERDHTLCHKVHALDGSDRGDGIGPAVCNGDDGLFQVPAHGVRRCAAADHMQALLGEEEPEHALVVLRIGRRPDDHVHGLPLAHLEHKRRNVVIRGLQAKGERSVHEHGRKVLRRNIRRVPTLQALDHILAGPALLHHLADACIRDAVRH